MLLARREREGKELRGPGTRVPGGLIPGDAVFVRCICWRKGKEGKKRRGPGARSLSVMEALIVSTTWRRGGANRALTTRTLLTLYVKSHSSPAAQARAASHRAVGARSARVTQNIAVGEKVSVWVGHVEAIRCLPSLLSDTPLRCLHILPILLTVWGGGAS